MTNWDQLELDRWAPTLQWGVARLLYQTFPRLATSALEMAASGLGAPRIPHLFYRDLRELPPSLNDDLLDLFGRSERTLSNQFTFQGTSEEFPEKIGWELHESVAWRAELHAFDYGLDLALNYRISGEERYARHLRYLVAHWIGANQSGQGTGWLPNPLARRVRNWILAADLARGDWERDTIFFELVANSLALQTTFLLKHAAALRVGDDALDSARALHLAGKFFGGRKGSELCSEGKAILLNEIERHFTSDGRYAESRPGSQLRLARTVIDFLVFEGGEDKEKSFFEEKLWEILKVIEGSLLPDGTLPLFGPAPASSGDDLADLFALAAVVLSEPMWKDLAGKFGVLPYMLLVEPGQTHFVGLPKFPWEPSRCLQPHCGLYRLSIAAESVMVINGRLPHSLEDHQDGLSYELAIHGQRVIVDSGAYASENASRAPYFASARAHNVLLVDGQGPRCVSSGESLPPADVLWEPGDRTIGLRVAQPEFLFGGLAHQRTWFCLDGQAWAILDGLSGAGHHSVTSLIHFYPTFEAKVQDRAAIVRSLSLTLTVIPLGHPNVKMIAERGHHPEFQGWYAPGMGMKYPASVLRLEWGNRSMPWVGGYLILPGTEISFEAEVTEPGSATISFRLAEKPYRLSMR